MHIKSFIKLFTLSCFLFIGTAQAQIDAKYSEQALLKAWEDNQRTQPTTKLFQKTKDKNIYLFETTLFPYKGKVVVHNVLINNDIAFYGDYEAREASDKIGVIEAELIDAPERFRETLFRSISVWQNQNTMYYFNDTEQWITAAKWKETIKPAQNKNECNYNSSNTKKDKKFTEHFTTLFSLLILISFFILLMRSTAKQQKKIDLSLDRQIKALELQKEQNELLKQILAKKE